MDKIKPLYPGVKCPLSPPQKKTPHICFNFYVMIKGLRRGWIFKVSENPSRGYWKQFLLPRLYEHSQNLPAVEVGGGGTLPRGKVSSPINSHVCVTSAKATVSHPTTELRWTLFPRLKYTNQKPRQGKPS